MYACFWGVKLGFGWLAWFNFYVRYSIASSLNSKHARRHPDFDPALLRQRRSTYTDSSSKSSPLNSSSSSASLIAATTTISSGLETIPPDKPNSDIS